jgi:uncharacterized membrane protein YdjX (TVP38/TMEM64 family)
VWIKILALLIIVWVTVFVAHETHVVEFFLNKEQLTGFIASLGPLGFVGFILLQIAQVVAAPIPGEVTGLLGGYLYGPVLGVVLSTIGLTLGSYLAFAFSRFFGRPFVERFVSKTIIDRFDYLLHHKGAFVVFLLFLIPGFPKDYLCYVLGLGHLSTLEFLVIGGTGRLFGTILLTLGGTYLKHHQYTRFFVLTGVALVVVLVAMAYRDKIERLLRILHVRDYRRKKAKRLRRTTG